MFTRHPLINYFRKSPTTPPTWRWDRAMQLARACRPPSSKDYDRWVQIAFWIAIRQIEGKPIREHELPVVEAQKLYETGGLLTAEIEARTLAHEQTPVIAGKCLLPAKTVLAYQRLFFGVESRLDQPHYIHNAIIQTHRPFGPSDVGRLWKYFAYRGGPKVIDHIIDHFRRMDRPDYTALLRGGLPPTQHKTALDLKWELALRLQLMELTASQVVTLRDIAARRAEQVLPAQAPLFNSQAWMDRQLDAVLTHTQSDRVSDAHAGSQ